MEFVVMFLSKWNNRNERKCHNHWITSQRSELRFCESGKKNPYQIKLEMIAFNNNNSVNIDEMRNVDFDG